MMSLKIISQWILGGVICLSCTGCTYNSQFDCPVPEGNKCTSLSQNSAMADRGEVVTSNSLVRQHIPDLYTPSRNDSSVGFQSPTLEPGSECYFREDF